MSLTRAVRGRISSTAPPSSRINGYNLNKIGYFYSCYPFLDVTKVGGGFYGTGIGAYDSNDFLAALPAGITAHKGLTAGLDDNYGYFPPGDYEIVSTSAATLNIQASTGVSARVSGVGRATFTVTALPGNWSSLLLTIDVTNGTGSPIAVTNLRCNLVSNATAILAGEIFDAAYVAAHANAKAIRIHDWFGTDDINQSAWTRKFSELNQNLGKSSWQPVPCSVAMRFAKAVRDLGAEARPWINVPCGMGMAYYQITASTNRVAAITSDTINDPTRVVKAHGLAEGEAFRFVDIASGTTPAGLAPLSTNTTYYAKNVTTNDFQVALTLGGSAVTFTFGTNAYPPQLEYTRMASMAIDPYNDMILPFLTACYTADPTAKPMIEVGGENWNSSFPTYFWIRGIAGLLAGGGDPAYDGYTAAGSAWLHLLARKAALTLWGVGNFTLIHPGQGIPLFGDVLTPSFTYLDPTNVFDSATDQAAKYRTWLAAGGSVPAVVYSIGSYMIQQGDWLQAAYASNGNNTAIPDSLWDSMFNAEISGRATDSTSGINGAQGYVPGMKIVFYEWGQQVDIITTGNATTFAVANNLFTYFDTLPGKAMYQRYWAAVVTPHAADFYAACHYAGAGGNFNNTNFVFAWCPINAANVETPRSLWLKTV